MVKRIPNIKKLRIHYQGFEGESDYYLNNLGHLHKLESLGCMFYSENKSSRSDFLHNLSFPYSLKKLTLEGVKLHWEDVATKIGCDDLEYWITESSHFPRLEHLVLRDLENLKEIPLDIGDILTLGLIVAIQLPFLLKKCWGKNKNLGMKIFV
ncbi:hypothetical protein ACS0TY_006786 [Phlomoides rotata]